MNSIYRAKKPTPKRKKWNKFLLICAAFFLITGLPVYGPLLSGVKPWSSTHGAAAFQAIGCALACIVCSWLFREEKR